jgi:hypothetical protein
MVMGEDLLDPCLRNFEAIARYGLTVKRCDSSLGADLVGVGCPGGFAAWLVTQRIYRQRTPIQVLCSATVEARFPSVVDASGCSLSPSECERLPYIMGVVD